MSPRSVWIRLLGMCHRNGVTRCVAFCVWCFSLRTPRVQGPATRSACQGLPPSSQPSNVPVHGYTPHFIYPFIWMFAWFPPLPAREDAGMDILLFTAHILGRRVCSFLLSRFLGIELPCQMETLLSPFEELLFCNSRACPSLQLKVLQTAAGGSNLALCLLLQVKFH